MVTLYHLLFLSLSLALLLPTHTDLAADRAALLRLQAGAGGRAILWNASDATPCSWQGVRCDDATNRVTWLRLPGSGLRGPLPLSSVGNLTQLRVLSLRGNSLSGQLPADLSSCTLLEKIHLQGNSFSGEIPQSFFTLTSLLHVNFAGNSFTGNLSSAFNNLTSLRTLYLENNRFAGSLPDWNRLDRLRNFNVSFNGLIGSIPSSLSHFPSQSFLNNSLCGVPLSSCSGNNGDSSLSNGAIAGIAIGSSIAFLLILVVLFVWWRTFRGRKILPRSERSPIPRSPAKPLDQEAQVPNTTIEMEQENRTTTEIKNRGSDGLIFFGADVEAFVLEELLVASAEVLGKGTIGSTYRAYLDSGVEVIVKRLKKVCVSEEEFRASIEEVGSLVHENLEPLRGYFYGSEEKLLLYQSVTKGSLSELLHGDGNNNRPVSWELRARIALTTASAIEYLHSVSSATTHGNMKSSNILLSDRYDARVSEYGLTPLVSSAAALSGYRAPEVTDIRRASQQADVYSFGVVLLELLTGKEPDRVLAEEGMELPDWVRLVMEQRRKEQVFDPDFVRFESVEEQMVQLLGVAVDCTSQSPERRPSMTEARRRVEEICN